ncbi:uL22 family ribosomal protein [Candidatus Vidania fulgoroideorum]
MIEEKNSINNINCSFKKLKKIVNFIKRRNIIQIFNSLKKNKSKSFRYLYNLFLNNLNNFSKKYNYNINFIKIKYIFVTKGKIYKKIYPRAKGKCDFLKRITSNVFLCLIYFLNG